MTEHQKDFQKGEIVIYRAKEGPILEVRLEQETVWLTQKQIAVLFDKAVPTINEHIKNIYKEKELGQASTIRKFRIVQKEGARSIERDVDFYNLDVIISVGYRVKSHRGIQFRVWATKRLKDYLIKGYAINRKRLLQAESRFHELQETIDFLKNKSKHELLTGKEREILDLLANYSKTLTLLEQYDTGTLTTVRKGRGKFVLDYTTTHHIITEVKRDLQSKKETSDLFGQERGDALTGPLGAIHQTFNGKELYPSIEEKAAHLLYFLIKDHPFTDGNKRIGSFLFVYFLDKNYYLYKESGEKKINDNALTALTLLIAISDPKEKDKMIQIITNLVK